jgi:hypothetical protein
MAAVALLLLASTLLIANTIRLSIFSRRREIEVMKLGGELVRARTVHARRASVRHPRPDLFSSAGSAGRAATWPITPFAWRYDVIVMATWVSAIKTSERALGCLYD